MAADLDTKYQQIIEACRSQPQPWTFEGLAGGDGQTFHVAGREFFLSQDELDELQQTGRISTRPGKGRWNKAITIPDR